MKKTLMTILVVCMLFSNAFAEENSTSPILFRNIPWGSSMQTVLRSFDGLSFSEPRDDYAGTVNHYIYENSDIRYTDYVCTKVYARQLNGMMVAGYELSNLYLYFAYTPDETRTLPKDENHTAFTMGEYKIVPKDLSFVMNDLMQKLSRLYGEPVDHKTTGWSITHDIYVWRGADGTVVSLIGENYSSGSTYIYIRYSFDGANEYYQNAMDALAYEEMLNTDTDDVSGL